MRRWSALFPLGPEGRYPLCVADIVAWHPCHINLECERGRTRGSEMLKWRRRAAAGPWWLPAIYERAASQPARASSIVARRNLASTGGGKKRPELGQPARGANPCGRPAGGRWLGAPVAQTLGMVASLPCLPPIETDRGNGVGLKFTTA